MKRRTALSLLGLGVPLLAVREVDQADIPQPAHDPDAHWNGYDLKKVVRSFDSHAGKPLVHRGLTLEDLARAAAAKETRIVMWGLR